MSKSLEGLTALVTGATSGLGQAIAVKLARDGAEVVVHGRDAGRGAQTVDAIRAEGGRARFVAADLGDRASIARLVKEVGEIDRDPGAASHEWGEAAQRRIKGRAI
jgi:NAD(P)-dependent dehydrogenase (short-subunit alcohol dehydrogenase family)